MAIPSCLRAAALAACLAAPAVARAQLTVTPITREQSAQGPFMFSGRLSVMHGGARYFGTATSIRRYTALTCGHLLYNEQTGFSTGVEYRPAFYEQEVRPEHFVTTFAILSGYQPAADMDGDSDEAFARDFAYVLTWVPANFWGWANWAVKPEALLQPGVRLVLGYAAETLSGDKLAEVTTAAPYKLLRDGLYESRDYYTQSGMSGGPVYLFDGDRWQLVAETVAGTSPPRLALSDVRAITADTRAFLIDPEYNNQFIKGGYITGPAAVAAGATAKFKCGAIFTDDARESSGQPRYEEIELKAIGATKAGVTITKVKAGKFRVRFGGLQAGQKAELILLRDTLVRSAQTPLARYTVTID